MPEIISLDDFADSLNELIPELLRGFGRYQSNEFSNGTISVPQFIVLTLLRKRNSLKMSELAAMIRVSTAAMTGTIDRLVKLGYVQRVFSPADRRVILVELTTRGSGLTEKIMGQRRRAIFSVFGRISERERKNYLNVLMQVRTILLQEEESSGPDAVPAGQRRRRKKTGTVR